MTNRREELFVSPKKFLPLLFLCPPIYSELCSVFSRKVPWRRFIWSKSAISATWSEWHSWRDRRTPKFYVATQQRWTPTFQPQILHFGTGITYQGARNWGRPRRFHGLALPSGTFRYDYFALYGLTAWFTDGYFSTLYYCTLFLLLTDRPFPRVFQPEWCILVIAFISKTSGIFELFCQSLKHTPDLFQKILGCRISQKSAKKIVPFLQKCL